MSTRPALALWRRCVVAIALARSASWENVEAIVSKRREFRAKQGAGADCALPKAAYAGVRSGDRVRGRLGLLWSNDELGSAWNAPGVVDS